MGSRDEARVIATVVVPCHNEAQRLDAAAFLSLVEDPTIRLSFVDDGSSDATPERLRALERERPDRVDVLTFATNRGKAEAVREGMLAALSRGADIVGYCDADLATPVTEIRRLVDIMKRGDEKVILASRVGLLGRRIQRKPVRHYLGRVFATAASLLLRLEVYDTQCGMKLFRRTAALEAALEDPFASRWVFDVELLGRLVLGAPGVPGIPVESIREEPLEAWRDVAGSKLRTRQMLGAARDLVAIRRALATRAARIAEHGRRAASE